MTIKYVYIIYYILFLYEDHFIQVYQFNYNYLTEELKYMHHNEITFDKECELLRLTKYKHKSVPLMPINTKANVTGKYKR